MHIHTSYTYIHYKKYHNSIPFHLTPSVLIDKSYIDDISMGQNSVQQVLYTAEFANKKNNQVLVGPSAEVYSYKYIV